MRVLVTGADGATARYLSQYILAEHANVAEVYGYTRESADLSIMHDAINAIKAVEPDLVFHLAGRTRIAESFERPAPFFRDNTLGTLNLLEAVRHFSPKAKVLVTSTCEVYGITNFNAIDERYPFAPASPYAASKAAADLTALMYAHTHKLHVVVSRLFNLINPRAEHLFSSSFARQVAEIEIGQRKELTHGNLSSARTLLDVRDVVRAYWMLLEKGTPGEAYNIGAAEEVTLSRFIDALARKATCYIPLRLDPALVRPVDIPTQIANSKKFLLTTGWGPRYSLDESIDFLLNHWRRNVSK